MQKPPKIMSEAETRKEILIGARRLGCEKETLQIFSEVDELLRNCTNPAEREAIAVYGAEKIHFLLSSRPGYWQVGSKIIGKE